jgi:hypothetical protein
MKGNRPTVMIPEYQSMRKEGADAKAKGLLCRTGWSQTTESVDISEDARPCIPRSIAGWMRLSFLQVFAVTGTVRSMRIYKAPGKHTLSWPKARPHLTNY